MTELTHYRQPTMNGYLPTDFAPPQAVTAPPPGSRLLAWAESLSAAGQIAEALCRTAFVPAHFKGKPAEAAAALMLGEELGMAPVSALRSIYVISGTPGLYAKAMVALVQSRGHQVWTEHDTPEKVVVRGQRRGDSHVEKSEWTTARARKAGYTNNRKYETDPQAMLYARAASDVCRKIAADVLSGVPYTVEEMELEATPIPTRKIARAKAEPPPMPEPALLAEEDELLAKSGYQLLPTPMVEAAELDTELPEPAAITREQVVKIATVMGKMGIVDRDSALQYVADTIGRTVESRNDLTKTEASLVIDALERELPPEPEPMFDD